MIEAEKKIISDYFNSWVTGDSSQWTEWFADNVRYEESTGTGYIGIGQMLRWQNEWVEHGKVIDWSISDILFSQGTYTVCWKFSCCYDGNESTFNGVSLISFNEENRMTYVREFAAQADIAFPYN